MQFNADREVTTIRHLKTHKIYVKNVVLATVSHAVPLYYQRFPVRSLALLSVPVFHTYQIFIFNFFTLFSSI